MTRPVRTDDELRAASDHLFYEVMMLKHTMERLASGPEDDVVSNALLESFTIHARALMDFFYPSEKPEATDVIAQDFFVDAQAWADVRGDQPEIFGKARRRVNKEIAHLTYDRQAVTPALKGWDLNALGGPILEISNKFLANVPKRLLGLRWSAIRTEPAGIPFAALPRVEGTMKTDVSTPGNLSSWGR